MIRRSAGPRESFRQAARLFSRSADAVPSITLDIDPHDVLGLAEGASLQEIRDAYRRKAKLLHPDAGGEAWAFRILSQAYENLSAARISRAAWAEFAARPTAARVVPREPEPHETEESVHAGVQDVVLDPARVVDIEKLWVRRDVGGVWLLRDRQSPERFLSCSLNVTWPSEPHETEALAIADRGAVLEALSEVFAELESQSGATSSNAQTEDGRFSGWLSYPDLNRAAVAFRELHRALRARGFGVRSWTRDLTIPREPR